MGVRVQRDAHVGMAQPLRHHFRLDASQEHECGVGVTEVVKAKMSKATSLDYAGPGAPEIGGIHGCP